MTARLKFTLGDNTFKPKMIINGGGPTLKSHYEYYKDDCKIFGFPYGTTETSSIISMGTNIDEKFIAYYNNDNLPYVLKNSPFICYVGKVIESNEVEISDDDIIHVKGGTVCCPDFDTQDIGKMGNSNDGGGILYVYGRKSEQVKLLNGEFISLKNLSIFYSGSTELSVFIVAGPEFTLPCAIILMNILKVDTEASEPVMLSILEEIHKKSVTMNPPLLRHYEKIRDVKYIHSGEQNPIFTQNVKGEYDYKRISDEYRHLFV
jgi:long-subunit acyl-CoA synthetase (AMP-forming)